MICIWSALGAQPHPTAVCDVVKKWTLWVAGVPVRLMEKAAVRGPRGGGTMSAMVLPVANLGHDVAGDGWTRL